MTRFEIFESLRVSYGSARHWAAAKEPGPIRDAIFRWRKEWWAELERGFPEYIKDGWITAQHNLDAPAIMGLRRGGDR